MSKPYLLAADTDIGLTKETNQDSLFMRHVCHRAVGDVVLAVICDGMGGLDRGEVASAQVVKAFDEWLSGINPVSLKEQADSRWVYDEFNHIIQKQNQIIREWGSSRQIHLGTTVTALLFISNTYYLIHVGDSRVYELKHDLVQLTEDQTVVAKEQREGILSAAEARVDARRNVLLQCVGASERVVPQYKTGEILADAIYLLCTDGFRHELTGEEIFTNLNPSVLHDKAAAQSRLRGLIDLNKARAERDNITAAIIRT